MKKKIIQEGFLLCQTPTSTLRLKVEGFRVKNVGCRINRLKLTSQYEINQKQQPLCLPRRCCNMYSSSIFRQLSLSSLKFFNFSFLILGQFQFANIHKLRYDTVVESTGVFIGFYLPCERTSLGPIITKPISKDTPSLGQRILQKYLRYLKKRKETN